MLVKEKNIEKDKIKTDWPAKNNITLLRLWENDIKNNLDIVIEKLKTLV